MLRQPPRSAPFPSTTPFRSVCVKLPLVPVIVTVALPVVAVLPASSVNVLLVVVLDGLNVAVTPDGNPEADRLTLPVKPFKAVTEIVLVPLEPWVTVTLAGEADNEKSGGTTGLAITDTVTACVWIPSAQEI